MNHSRIAALAAASLLLGSHTAFAQSYSYPDVEISSDITQSAGEGGTIVQPGVILDAPETPGARPLPPRPQMAPRPMIRPPQEGARGIRPMLQGTGTRTQTMRELIQDARGEEGRSPAEILREVIDGKPPRRVPPGRSSITGEYSTGTIRIQGDPRRMNAGPSTTRGYIIRANAASGSRAAFLRDASTTVEYRPYDASTGTRPVPPRNERFVGTTSGDTDVVPPRPRIEAVRSFLNKFFNSLKAEAPRPTTSE